MKNSNFQIKYWAIVIFFILVCFHLLETRKQEKVLYWALFKNVASASTPIPTTIASKNLHIELSLEHSELLFPCSALNMVTLAGYTLAILHVLSPSFNVFLIFKLVIVLLKQQIMISWWSCNMFLRQETNILYQNLKTIVVSSICSTESIAPNSVQRNSGILQDL